MCLGSNRLNVPNSSCKHRVPELQAKPTSCNDVTLYCRTAPSTPVDCHSLWGFANAVEPASPDPVGAIVEHPDCVNRILGGYQDTVAPSEVTFFDLFNGIRVLGYRF
jgi:hypothetical protein